jgi:hypothetical protein
MNYFNAPVRRMQDWRVVLELVVDQQWTDVALSPIIMEERVEVTLEVAPISWAADRWQCVAEGALEQRGEERSSEVEDSLGVASLKSRKQSWGYNNTLTQTEQFLLSTTWKFQ